MKEVVFLSVFCTSWVDGKIDNIEELIRQNPNRNYFYVLDTNFVIYCRNYIEDRIKFKNENKAIYIEFLNTVKYLKKQDSFIYQYGCEESSRDKLQGKLNIEKYKYSVYCLNKILNKNFCDNIITDDKSYPIIENSKINVIRTNKLQGIKLMIAYAGLLKAFLIKKFDCNLSNEEKIYKYCKFLDKELNIMSPLYISFAIHYFGNASSILKKVRISNKISQIMDKIYAAAIDLTLPTISAQLSDYNGFNSVPIFITFDKGIKLIFDSLIVYDAEMWNGNIIPRYQYKVFYDSGWNDNDIIRISSNVDKICVKRKKDYDNKIRKESSEEDYLNICISLEKELKIQKMEYDKLK